MRQETTVDVDVFAVRIERADHFAQVDGETSSWYGVALTYSPIGHQLLWRRRQQEILFWRCRRFFPEDWGDLYWDLLAAKR